MQIVIDIPEEAYNLLKGDGVDWLGAEHILSCVEKGKILPKGHGRLIDADSVIKYWKPDHDRQFVADYFIHTLEVADTVIDADKEG